MRILRNFLKRFIKYISSNINRDNTRHENFKDVASCTIVIYICSASFNSLYHSSQERIIGFLPKYPMSSTLVSNKFFWRLYLMKPSFMKLRRA